jgi:hypothetical protein
VAPLKAMIEAPRMRTGRKSPVTVADPAELAALPEDVRALLRSVAALSVQRLGVRDPSDAMIADEMRAQFATIAPSVVSAPDRNVALRDVAQRLLRELHEE